MIKKTFLIILLFTIYFLRCFAQLDYIPTEAELELMRAKAMQMQNSAIASQNASRAPQSIIASANLDTIVTFNTDSFASYCNTWKKTWEEKRLSIDEKQKAHTQSVTRPTSEPIRTDQIREESSVGTFLLSSKDYANLGVYFIFDAGSLLPGDALVVNNVGGLLRTMDEIPEALSVLLYANSLDPKLLVVLSQIGNSLFEYGDDKKAELFYKKCFAIDDDYPPAHRGMGAIYLKRGQPGDAYEEILRGATVGFGSEVAQVAEGAKGSCGFGQEDDDGFTGPEFPYEKAKNAIKKATKYISVSSAVVKEKNKMSIPQFPKWEGYEDYCQNGPTLTNKLLAENMGNEQKFADEAKSHNGASENPDYATEDFMFQSMTDICFQICNKLDKKYRKQKSEIEERAIKEFDDYGKLWSAKYTDCISKCAKAEDDKCMKNCFCTAMMDSWHNHQIAVKNLYMQWKSLTINLGDDLQKLQNDYYDATSDLMNRVYDKPMYERMDLIRAGFSNKLIYTFISGLNFTTYFCDGPQTNMDNYCQGGYAQFSAKDLELDKRKKLTAPECPKDKTMQITFAKMVTLSFECESVGVEYFNSITPTSPWVAGKYNWKKSQLTTIVGVGASVGCTGCFMSGSAKVGIINAMDFKTNEVDGGLTAKLDYTEEALNGTKKSYGMDAKAMVLEGADLKTTKANSYGNDGISVKMVSKTTVPSWSRIP